MNLRNFLIFLLSVFLLVSCKSQQFNFGASGVEVKEPEIEITSIVILQADLINTQFETVLRIKNPNDFAVELSSLSYELYGNDFFWAGGTGNDILRIPARSSCETKFNFIMNFINMNRRLLDDVIAMRRVSYRIKGEAEVRPSVSRVSPFTMSYDISGLSEVRPRRNEE
jgi:LEA14-like dessication related protein